MNQKKQNAILTIVFYCLAGILIYIFNSFKEFKSGPCTPNLDFLSLILIGPISLLVASLQN